MAVATLRCGSAVSPAAIATISVPPNAKITISRPAPTPATPVGAKSAKLERPPSWPGITPSSMSTPTTRNARITPTLMNANQNSNSPYLLTANMLMVVNRAMNTRLSNQVGGTVTSPMVLCRMPVRIVAAPLASAAVTTASCTQYSQPTV